MNFHGSLDYAAKSLVRRQPDRQRLKLISADQYSNRLNLI